MPEDTGVVQNANDGGQRSEGRTFTQVEVDAFVAERAKHAKSAAITELLQELGVSKPEELKASLAEYRKLKESQKSDVEKLTQIASEHERRAIAAESQIAATEIKADFVEKAVAAGVTDIRLAYLAAQAEGLLGSYDPDKGVGKHNLEELKKRYPHLFRATTGGSADAGAGGSGKIGGDMNAWIRRAAGRA